MKKLTRREFLSIVAIAVGVAVLPKGKSEQGWISGDGWKFNGDSSLLDENRSPFDYINARDWNEKFRADSGVFSFHIKRRENSPLWIDISKEIKPSALVHPTKTMIIVDREDKKGARIWYYWNANEIVEDEIRLETEDDCMQMSVVVRGSCTTYEGWLKYDRDFMLM